MVKVNQLCSVIEDLRDDLLAEGFTENDLSGNVQHHTMLMHQVYNAMVGQQQLRPLNPMAIRYLQDLLFMV